MKKRHEELRSGVALVAVLLSTLYSGVGCTRDTVFDYLVRVEARATSDCIQGAKVIIEVSQEPPLDETTDVNGIAVIAIDSSYANQRGRLIVEASGYRRYEQNIKLAVAVLPDVVQLEPLTDTSTPMQTQTASPTPEAASTTFQDFERENGTPPGGGDYFWDAWFTICSFESAIVREGSRSVRVDAHARAGGGPKDTGGTMGVNPASRDPVDLSSATSIYIWVYDTQGNNTVELKLRDIHDFVSNPVWSAMQSVKGLWTKIEWALSDFTGVDMRNIKNLEIYEWNDGIYYFDDVGWQ